MAEFQGNRTTLTMAAAPAGAFAEVLNIEFSGMSRGDVDFSHFGTTGTKKMRPTELRDGGQVSVEVLSNPAISPDALMVEGNAVFTFPTGDVWTVFAYVKDVAKSLPFHDRVTTTITLGLSEAIVVT